MSNDLDILKTQNKDKKENSKDHDQEDIKVLKSQLNKLKLESQLRKNLSSELERQKQIAVTSQNEALKKSEELELISKQLSKYLSPQLYEQIFSGKEQVIIKSTRKKLSMCFSDLVGFTGISDTLESEEITTMLNFYLTEMSKIVLEYGGTIDKFVGDAIIVFFGDPETKGVKEDAVNCVKMAIAMQKRIRELEHDWGEKFSLKKPLEMRIGINTGYCTVGNFGSDDRLDYTIIGGQVNLASRLEGIAKPGNIILSHDTYIQVNKEIDCIEAGTVNVKGIKEEIKIFQVLLDHNKNKQKKYVAENISCQLNLNNLNKEEFEKFREFLSGVDREIKK